ncbi:glycosyltransferase [Shewanella xiamenensis]|uniref:Glycosyltransferase n=1 Tax=Shewanella xiamenensis TaxID=332186 RepID=A0AAE4PZ80_9GAMM|nr:glycosyltransferase [Shewanella xiamenensis]MDV5390966.1 glycosyltransferase [Shewanella xiamenensis]
MKRILVVCKNFPYILGGAERSLLEELKKRDNCFFTFVNLKRNSSCFSLDYFHPYTQIYVNDYLKFESFEHLEYFYNKKMLLKFLNNLPGEFDEVITQGLWAPIAISYANSKGVSSTYYLRDESSLNIFRNYHVGAKYYIKNLKDSIVKFFQLVYCRDNSVALHLANTLISNSKFIQSEVLRLFNVKSTVVYPYVDVDGLLANYNVLSKATNCTKGVVLIGDSALKGVDIFLSLAKDLPQIQFYIFGKNTSFKSDLVNVKHMGWSSDNCYPFIYADVVLVPSKWHEAFGRVAVESKTLGIPVIVANRGGLPEAVNYDLQSIAVNDSDFKLKLLQILQ